MAKKLLALLLAMCMLFSVCAVSVFAEEPTGESTEEETTTEAAEEETTTEPEEEESEEETEEETDEEVEKSVNISLSNSYLPNDTVVVKGTVTGDVSVVRVEITCKDDRVEFEELVSASKFRTSGVSYDLEDATVGAEYAVVVYDDDTDEELGSDSFLIKKGNTVVDNDDDGSNKATIWIEGTTNRYIDETIVNLDVLKDKTVFDLAEYVLEEEDRNYKDNKKKITAIASTATSSTYTLKDGSTSSYLKDCTWNFFLNGVAYDADTDWSEVEINGGDQVVLYFGEVGKVIYPSVEVTPDDISANDTVTVTVTNAETDEPIKGAKVAVIKRGATSGTGKSTNADGEYTVKATASWITSYQGGKVMASYYQSSTKPLKMISVKQDLDTDRDGSVQAYVRIEGAHKTLLKRTKTAKIEEYDLYNFMLEVLEDEDIEYEANREETNFTYFESKTTSGYSNENGDITRDSGWYVVVNDKIYTPDDDLEDVIIYTNDEILFYFGDEDTVPVVYYKVDGELVAGKKVYVYFYSDSDLTDPIDDMDVYFDGDEYSDKRLNTNSDGRVTLPSVEYRGTYTLSWGEQVGVKADECPAAVYGSVELKFTGSAAPAGDDDDDEEEEKTSKESVITYKCDNCGDKVTKVYDVEYDGEDLEVCKDCRDELKEEEEEWNTKPTEPKDDPWQDGDYTEPTEPEDFVPGPSKYYPDPNIDAWAVANVNKAHEYELMGGTALGWFEPQREITRAEFTAIVCRILGLDHEQDFDEKFGDVTKKDWHFGYVMAAYEAGYVNGMSEISFAPNNYITREEIAVMVSRILNVTGNAEDVNLFADGYNVSAWAKIYVAAVNKTGIMTGDQFGQFLPKSQVNRQTVATIAVRVYEYLNK
ncbi:MAG: S-layer homology domain-containing protein [Clostridia bacterium]|nr:S-layer homology domain-containing protein [Clostridia bacterium]